ncbi:MAG: hypothetical protein ABJA67_08565 [Chthonomonadales bacterium]
MSAILHKYHVGRILLILIVMLGVSLGSVYVVKQVVPFRVKLLSKSVLLYKTPPKDNLDPSYSWIDDTHLLEHWFTRNRYNQDLLTVLNIQNGTYNDLAGINKSIAKSVGKRYATASRVLISHDKTRILIAKYFGDNPQDTVTIYTCDPTNDRVISTIERVPIDIDGGLFWNDDSASWSAVKLAQGHADGAWISTSFSRDGVALTTTRGAIDPFSIPHASEETYFQSPAVDRNGLENTGAFQGIEPGGFRTFSPDGKQAAWMTVNYPDSRASTFVSKQLQLLTGLNRWQAEVHVRDMKSGSERVIATLFESDLGPPNRLLGYRIKRQSLRWMPDGKRLSYILDRNLYAIPVE